MKRLVPALLFSLAACGANGGGLSEQQTEIPSLPMVESGQGSLLTVPKSCPIWSPGGGDVDTPEEPLPEHVSLLCAVDSTGASYGIVNGDAPTAELAIIPGSREVGLFIAVNASALFTPDRATLSGENPNIEAWSAPTNVYSRQGCCAEDKPNSRIAPRTVAVGNQGMLLSFGSFDEMPTQVAFRLNTDALFGSDPPAVLGPGVVSMGGWMGRFYVNRAP